LITNQNYWKNFVKHLKEKKTKNGKLQEKIDEEREVTREIREELEELKKQLYLSNNPLPKKTNKIKMLGEKVKTKFQQLIKREKNESKKLFARIEVRIK